MMSRITVFGFLMLILTEPMAYPQDSAEKQNTDRPGQKTRMPLEVGQDLPGAFNPFALNGLHKQHFHCFVSEHGLNPAVLVFVRSTDIPDGVKELLAKLDQLLDKKLNVKMGAFVIFVPEELNNQITEDVRRKELATKIEDEVIKPLKLKHVLFGLTSSKDIASYSLPASDPVTCIAYNKYRIQAIQNASKEGFKPEAVDAILKTVTEKLIGSPLKKK